MILIKKKYFEDFLSIISFLKKKKNEKILFIKISKNVIRFLYSDRIDIIYKKDINYPNKIEFSMEYTYIENIIKHFKENIFINIDLKKKNISIKKNKFLFKYNCILNKKKRKIKESNKNAIIKKILIKGSIFLSCLYYSSFIEKTYFVKKQIYNFILNKNKFECFISDGFRAFFYKDLNNIINKKEEIFISKNLSIFISRIIKKFNFDILKFKKYNKFLEIIIGDIKIYSSFFKKQKFDFREIIKIGKEYKKIIVINKDCLEILKKIEMCSLKKEPTINIKINNEKLKISYLGDNKTFLKDELIIIKNSSKNKAKIKINVSYLKDFLLINDSNKFNLYFLDNKSMIYLKSEKNKNFLYCFMPICN